MFAIEGIIMSVSIVILIATVFVVMFLWLKFCVDKEIPFFLYLSPYLLLSVVFLYWFLPWAFQQ
jgi:hypothetical protein